MREELSKYVKNMDQIRTLSSPKLDNVLSSDEYGVLLQDNFLTIGHLAVENRDILEKHLFGHLQDKEDLDDATRKILMDFEDELCDTANLDDLDPFVHSLVSEKLLKQTGAEEDKKVLIGLLDREVSICYTMISIASRIPHRREIAEAYRLRGIQAGKKLLTFLAPDLFDSLEDEESREAVLVNARYMWLLYAGKNKTPEECAYVLDMLERALSLKDNDYYSKSLEIYDWERYYFLTLYYYAEITGRSDSSGFDKKQLKKISKKVKELEKVWREDTEKYGDILSENELTYFLLCSGYEAGEISGENFRKKLVSLYKKSGGGFSGSQDHGIFFRIPTEYLKSLKGCKLTESDKYLVSRFYRNSLNYAHLASGSEALCDLLEYLTGEMVNFIEIPGGITFEEMGLGCMAALHPPTYVHSVMVAQIARCIARHLLNRAPEIFAGLNITEPQNILSFVYHAALCHDFGKLMIADTIMIYGRNLLDEEFMILKEHPRIGADLLSKYPSTAAYANVAFLHHLSFDGKGGYPGYDNPAALPEKAVIDIVTCADCLDAATDNVGRSYKKGKTIDEFASELRLGAGTRYAPYLADLFEDVAFREDIGFLLQQGRRNCYERTYGKIQEFTKQSILYGENL